MLLKKVRASQLDNTRARLPDKRFDSPVYL
jgi:hypothetical protein